MAEIISTSPAETRALGEKMAAAAACGELYLLAGELGSGKTEFVKGFAAGLGYRELVTSPTFTLLHEYPTTPPLFHLDLYRLAGGAVEGLGLDEYRDRGVVIVEWPEPGAASWTEPYVRVKFTHGDNEKERLLEIERIG